MVCLSLDTDDQVVDRAGQVFIRCNPFRIDDTASLYFAVEIVELAAQHRGEIRARGKSIESGAVRGHVAAVDRPRGLQTPRRFDVSLVIDHELLFELPIA